MATMERLRSGSPELVAAATAAAAAAEMEFIPGCDKMINHEPRVL